MEYQKIINLLDNTPNQQSKFGTKNCVGIYDNSGATYNNNNQIRFQTSMLKSRFCDYSDANILVKATIKIQNTEAVPSLANNTNKKLII